MQNVKFDHNVRNNFTRLVTRRIDNYFFKKNLSKKANWVFSMKGFFFLLLTVFFYIIILSSKTNGWSISLAILFTLFGLFNTIFVFSVAHDASHHAISEKKWINNLLEYVWDSAGISSYFWKLKHNVSHHSFTNVPGKDGDIDQSGLLLLNPESPQKWFHKYQHFYAPFLYSLLSLNIIYIKDFKLLFSHEYGNKIIQKHPVKEIFILFAGKLFFITYMIVIPKIVLHLAWIQIFSYHLMMNLAIGLFIGFVLVPVHVTEMSAFRLPNKNGVITCDWIEHQLEATVDFSADNYFINFITGGLNTHVAHHLFPSINHIHYYQITKIIKQTANDMGVPYRNYSWARVMLNHLKFLKILGNQKTTVLVPL